MIKHYITLIKPRICILVLVTSYLGYYMGLRSAGYYMITFNEWLIFTHLIIGTFLSCAGSCALNQAIEHKSDLLMDRTANRPIPRGIISVRQGVIYGILLSVTGVLYLYLTIGSFVSFLSLLTVLTYIFIYTPLKKISTINTLVGAIPGALPPIGGWFAANPDMTSVTAALFGILFCWQIPHFLSLAYMYADDYKKGGFVMLPSIYSNQIQTRVHMIFFTLSLISITFYLYLNKIVGDIYFAGNFILSMLIIYYVIKFSFNFNYHNAKKLFLVSIIYLPALLILVIINS